MYDNPYQPPQAEIECQQPQATATVLSATVPPDGKTWRFTDLPQKCPDCGRLIATRMYPRKTQKSTIALIVLSTLAAFFAGAIFPRGLSIVVFFVVLTTLGGAAMRRPKVVRLRCSDCGWTKNFLVRARG